MVTGVQRVMPSLAVMLVQEDSDEESSSSPNAVDEPYLRNNPAFEAYLDSDSDSTCSMESNACTTPRSAIQEQVPPCACVTLRSMLCHLD